VLQAVTEAQPDALIHLGDFGHSYKASRSASQRGYVRSMRLLDPLLRDMRARDAVLAVLGNHDYYFDAVAVRQWLEGLGIRVLVNEHHVLQRGSARLAVLGVDDAKEGGIDLARAADGLPDDLIPRILLSHNPDGVFAIEPESRLCVAISGHTHGGQVSLPWYGAPARFCRICGRRSANGWVPNDRVRLYVTKGVGGMIPFRINVPPEIVLARLRPANP
jgi:predicted MPP superfamily phosphohydrolase